VASIPEFMKTILTIDDDEERQFALSTSIVRRVMMNERTIGGWVTSMLQSKDKVISKRVIDYLKLVSEIAKGDQAKKGGRRKRFDRDLKDGIDLTGCDALVNEISRLENFVPALLALGNRGIEEASSTFVVQQVLDRMIARPFAVTVVFCDVIFLSLLIVGFRSAVNQLILGASLTVVLQWIYVANTGIFYFVIREIGKTVSLCVISKRARVYFVSFWNLIDMLATVLALTATISMRYHFTFEERGLEDASILRGLLAVTTGFLWLRVLSLLKAINRQLATFVLAILQITRDIFWFCVILLTMVISFAQIFYTLLAPSTCASGNASTMQCSQTEFLLRAYSVLLGDFGNFKRDDFKTGFSVFLIVFYSFMVTVVLLNVLIAVASDSYEKCLLRSVKLFGRARVMLIAELASFQNLLRKTDQRTEGLSHSTTIYSQFWSSRPWNHNWSRGSVLFFSLSLLVIVAWIVCEILGYSRGEHHGSIVLSLASIFVNVVLFVAIMAFLSTGAAGVASKKDPSDVEDVDVASINTRDWNNGFVQNVMLHVLGASKPTGNDEYSKANGVEDWNGRVHYLHREMSRITEEAVMLANEQSKAMENLVKLSESRLRTEFGSLERNFEYLRRDLMGEIQGTKETNALVSHAAEELKTLIAMQASTDCGFTLQTSPVPSVLDLNQTKFVRHDKNY
jgi:hypothetical protein